MELEWIQSKGRVSGWMVEVRGEGTNRSLDDGVVAWRVFGGSGRGTESGNVAAKTMSA
jgi:hypothetical protein